MFKHRCKERASETENTDSLFYEVKNRFTSAVDELGMVTDACLGLSHQHMFCMP